jgi:hypothetical protein
VGVLESFLGFPRLKTTEMCSLSVLEAGSQNKMVAMLVPIGGSEGQFFHSSFSFWWLLTIAGALWLTVTTSVSAFVCTYCSFYVPLCLNSSLLLSSPFHIRIP